ncbi:MAG: tetratricopeptide repeat protein [Bacteroides sp.]|nr:tetratricopeptide repeat protein [Bacteroides sp.]MCI1683372.1 tetratricopeptide repeat protein [Bacteroides sp.]
MRTLLLVLLMGSTSLAMGQSNALIQEAMANYNFKKALILINKEQPTIPLLYQKGKALKSLNYNSEALEVFKQIAKEDSLNPRPYIETAECYKALAKYKQALLYYQEAIRLNPDNSYAHIQEINTLLMQERYKEALKESLLLTAQDSSATALHLQAQSLEGLKEAQPTIKIYQLIQAKYPKDYLAPAKLAALYIEGNMYDEAIETTEKYRKIDSTNIAVNRQNALAYCLNKEYPTAIMRYKELVNQGDSSFYTTYYLGISSYAIGQFYDAHDMLEIAFQSAPQNINLLYYLGRACAKTSWKQEGVKHLQEAINLAIPKDSAMSRLYMGLTDCYEMARMPKQQLDAIKERYEKYDKGNHKLLYDMAFIYYYELKDYKNTVKCLESYLASRPDKEDNAPQTDDEGNIIIGNKNYYNAAANWLKDLKKQIQTDKFFKGNTSQHTVTLLKQDSLQLIKVE